MHFSSLALATFLNFVEEIDFEKIHDFTRPFADSLQVLHRKLSQVKTKL